MQHADAHGLLVVTVPMQIAHHAFDIAERSAGGISQQPALRSQRDASGVALEKR